MVQQKENTKVSVGDFLYSDQLVLAFELKDMQSILTQIIEPNIDEMRFKLDDSKVHPLFLATLVSQHVERNL